MTHTSPPSAAAVPAMIEQAMRRTGTHYYRALNLPIDTYTDQATRAARLAAVCEDRARCWAALARWACTPGSTVAWALVSAVISARHQEDDAARFWRDTADYWARAAAGTDPRDLDAEDLDLCGRGRWSA